MTDFALAVLAYFMLMAGAAIIGMWLQKKIDRLSSLSKRSGQVPRQPMPGPRGWYPPKPPPPPAASKYWTREELAAWKERAEQQWKERRPPPYIAQAEPGTWLG